MNQASDDLDDLLDDRPIVVDEEELLAPGVPDEELNRLVTPPIDLQLAQAMANADLTEFEEQEPGVSLLTRKGSSLTVAPRRRVKFKDFSKLDLRKKPVRWAQHIWNEANAQDIGANPIDRLSEPRIMELTAALQQCEAKILEGHEAAILLCAPGAEFQGKPLGDIDRLCLHLNAMGMDHVVILKLFLDTAKIRRGLLERGLSEGRDYEFIEPSSLLPYERQVFDRLLSKSTNRLRIIRRVSKLRAKL